MNETENRLSPSPPGAPAASSNTDESGLAVQTAPPHVDVVVDVDVDVDAGVVVDVDVDIDIDVDTDTDSYTTAPASPSDLDIDVHAEGFTSLVSGETPNADGSGGISSMTSGPE